MADNRRALSRKELAAKYPDLDFRAVNALDAESGGMLPDTSPQEAIRLREEQARWGRGDA